MAGGQRGALSRHPINFLPRGLTPAADLKKIKRRSKAALYGAPSVLPDISPTGGEIGSFNASAGLQPRSCQQAALFQDGIGHRRQQRVDLLQVADGIEVDRAGFDALGGALA